MEITAQIGDARTKKHISKMDNLVDASPKAESQQWETEVTWPDMSILEDNCSWEDDTEDAEEDIYDEKEDTQGEEEEGDEN